MKQPALALPSELLTLCLAVALVAPACGDDGAGPADGAGTASDGTTGDPDNTTATTGDMVDETGTTPTVTFWQDVAPVFYQSCATCHREAGVAPFALQTYEDASQWANAVQASVQSRTMPPWLVTDDGTCGEFRYSRWLPQDTVDMISSWVDQGMPEGDPRDDLTIPELPAIEGATDLQTPNFTPEIQGGDLAEFDEYRCFLVDPELPGDRFITGYDVLPGNDALVHHVLVMPVDPELMTGDGRTNAEVMQDLDDQSPEREGWPCFGAAGEGVEENSIPVVWAPGQGVVDFPEGTGLRVGEDDLFVIQMHYNLANEGSLGMSDQSTVQLRLEESVDREAFMFLPDPFLDSIFQGEPEQLPPGQPSVKYEWEMQMGPILAWMGLPSVDLLGVFPHMHEYGQAMRMDIDGAEGSECAADVPRWDFNWQLQYFYQESRTLTDADTIRVVCDFDTLGADEPVLPGWGTRNEMCLMGMYVVP